MHASPLHPTLASTPSTNPLETYSALKLDARGRIRFPVVREETHFKIFGGRRASETKFTQYLDPADREHIEAIYLEGIRDGQLYRFVDTAIDTKGGPQAVTLLLYYHPTTDQAWLFVETKAGENYAPTPALCAAA